MPAQWTADLISKMHLSRISAKRLAEEVGMTPEYLSMILNGHREPKGAEESLNAALDRLISDKSQSVT